MKFGVIGWLKDFAREMDLGLSVMRGVGEPGASGSLERRCEQDDQDVASSQGGRLTNRGDRSRGGTWFRTERNGDLSLQDLVRPLKRLGGRLHPGGGRRLAVFALLLAMALWGSVFVATKEVMGEAGPFTVAASRFAIGFAVLLPLARREGFTAKLMFRPTYLLFGFTGVFLAYGLQNLALVLTSAGNAALVVAMQPAAIVLMGMLVLRERLPIGRLLGIGLAIGGVMLVSGVAFAGGGSDALLGNALMAGSVLAYSAYAVQGRSLGANSPAILITAASFATGLMFLLPFVAGEFYLYGVPELGTGSWLVLLYLGISTTAATFLLWNYALRHLEAGAAGLYFSLIPVTGLTFAVLFGGSVGILEIVGGALAISGVLVGDYLVRHQKPSYPQTEA